tara:strand:+ start:611 stop:970 length:360 start_codon:yes stop_codon:yes gene_type:complete
VRIRNGRTVLLGLVLLVVLSVAVWSLRPPPRQEQSNRIAAPTRLPVHLVHVDAPRTRWGSSVDVTYQEDGAHEWVVEGMMMTCAGEMRGGEFDGGCIQVVQLAWPTVTPRPLPTPTEEP